MLSLAVERGINLFDVGYYWDKPDTEEAFAAAMRTAGLRREQYMLALKLWLWNYPEQSLAEQAKASLRRLDVDHVDVVMVSRPTPEVDFAAFCEEVDALVRAGIARAWGVTNWEPEQIEAACAVLNGRSPCLVQLQYNVARRNVVEDARYARLFASGQSALCAAFVLEGGILAGHLDRDRVNPSDFARGERPRERNIARDAGGVREQIRASQPRLREIARAFGASAAQLAIAFTLTNPATATALIGVTKTTNLEENLGALRLLDSQQEWLPLLESLRVTAAHPRLFDPVKHE